MFKKFLASCVVVSLMDSPVLANQNTTKNSCKNRKENYCKES
ncbi:hypothetical protein DESAMIL20_1633 [Desulfurella amilsii]|uniref:Uncharacterized protein n=1 Tax=Desulfurella amilsii TaxID=1562698 RepID=A0A1X4XX12_9BACT|nr:hypothetical protein [Desulfurella amilsii]OSS42080.1 hypothetical protein DESAMIL20_1633 [Desulfurella amilsii]